MLKNQVTKLILQHCLFVHPVRQKINFLWNTRMTAPKIRIFSNKPKLTCSVVHVGFSANHNNMAFNDFYLNQRRLGLDVRFISYFKSESSKDFHGSLTQFILWSFKFRRDHWVVHFHTVQLAWIFKLIDHLLLRKSPVFLTVHTTRNNLSRPQILFLYLARAMLINIIFCSNSCRVDSIQIV